MFIYILHSHLQVLMLRLKKNEKFFSNRFAILEQCHFSIKRLKLFGRIWFIRRVDLLKIFFIRISMKLSFKFCTCLANFMNHTVICIIDIIINTRAINVKQFITYLVYDSWKVPRFLSQQYFFFEQLTGRIIHQKINQNEISNLLLIEVFIFFSTIIFFFLKKIVISLQYFFLSLSLSLAHSLARSLPFSPSLSLSINLHPDAHA